MAAISIENEAERNYLFHLLKAKNSDLNNQGTESTFKAIGKAVLEDVLVPQISREEQQKCIDMMDFLESIIRERKTQLASVVAYFCYILFNIHFFMIFIVDEYEKVGVKMLLYHYFDKKTGPFKNLSDLSDEEANRVLLAIKAEKPDTMCAKRQDSYIADRRRFESILRREFQLKGGIIEREAPHYLVVGECPWLSSWFEDCDYIVIDTADLDLSTISFTYGDSHPTFSDRVNDGKEYRKKLYTYDEIVEVIKKYGLPQDWNPDGRYGPERYVEAHVWSDRGILNR